MRKWFKACIILTVLGIVTLLVDFVYSYQIDNLVGYYFSNRISIFGYHPFASLLILFFTVIIFALAYFSFLLGAKPVLDRELLGKKIK